MAHDYNTIYLTFDDGPTEQATAFVLDQLAKYQAKATFFCIGDNVRKHPLLYQQLLADGHAVGNHTYHHKNGWKTYHAEYVDEVMQCSKIVKSTLFRPPYGRLTWRQFKSVKKHFQVVMWDVLSYDFNPSMTAKACIERVLKSTKPGSIVVFHDSEKCFPLLKDVLPQVLEAFQKKGWQMQALTTQTHE